MEEARVQFFKDIGFDYAELEKTGVYSPVVAINNCRYRQPTRFDDTILIDVTIKQYTGVRIVLHYSMYNGDKLVFEGESEHCFVTSEGKIVKVGENNYPEFHQKLKSLVSE